MRFQKRAYAVLHVIEDGLSVKETAKLMKCSTRSVHRWVGDYLDTSRVDVLKDKPRSGRPRKIKEEQFFKAAAELTQVKVEQLQQVIYKMTNVKYTAAAIRIWLHRCKFAWKKPRPYYIHQASRKKVKEWQRKNVKQLKALAKRGIPVFVADEVHVHFDDNCRGKVWYYIGKPARIPYENKYWSFRYFGAYSLDGKMFVRKYSKGFTAKVFVKYLQQMYDRYGRFAIVLDNARPHTAKMVKEFCDEMGILLIFLPVGRPELSVIETIWHLLKSKHIHGQFHEDVVKLEKKIRSFLGQKFDLDIFEYLQRNVLDNQ